MKRVLFTVVLVALAFVAMPSGSHADEVATIVNESNFPVEFFLKWASLPNESQKIVLAPNQAYKAGSVDGDALFMRFNSTPRLLNPPREVRLRLNTARVNPFDRGWVSSFRNGGGELVVIDPNLPR